MAPLILLVDDDAAVREAITFALEVEGFEVASFASAEQALAHESGRPVACAVIDYRLTGMDGLALLDVLRESNRALPTIVLTSQPSQRLKTEVRGKSAVLIEKPILCGSVLETIREILT